MAKSAKIFDVNIALSKCEFIGVGDFERIYTVGHTEISVFACICKNAILSKKAAG